MSAEIHQPVFTSLIAQTPAFKQELDRIIQGAAKMRVAIMCAEKDPLDCHRCILVSPRLRERGIEVQHNLAELIKDVHTHAPLSGFRSEVPNPNLDLFNLIRVSPRN